jgi:hypothetical protein
MVDPKYPASRIIDCVAVAKARAWLQISEAGSPPVEVDEFLGSLGLACQAQVASRSGLLHACTASACLLAHT